MEKDPHHPDPSSQDELPIGDNPPRVFVVQYTQHNLVKATRFGTLVALVPARVNITMQPQPVIHELRQKLQDFGDNDFLLPLGDPVAIGLAFCIAAEINRGRLKILKWDRELNDYYVVNVDIYDRG